MATYLELRQLFENGDLLNKIDVACIIAAEAIRVEAPATANHANRLLWATSVFADPRPASRKMLMAMLASNAALTSAQIIAATDAILQTKVTAAVDIFATGG